MANQYTAAHEAGITPDDPEWPQQKPNRRSHPEEVRQAIRAAHIARYLESIVEDANQETAHRISASKILLDKTIPNLSSVEQTNIDGTAEASQEELEAKLRALVSKANPALLSRILGERAKDLAHMGITEAEVGNDPDQPISKTA